MPDPPSRMTPEVLSVVSVVYHRRLAELAALAAKPALHTPELSDPDPIDA